MKLKLFLVLLTLIGVVAFAWLNPDSFRTKGDRKARAAAMETEVRKIQEEYNVDYAEALAIFERRNRER